MAKYRRSSSYSRACKKVKSAGHFKTSFGGKHVRVTVGTKGIHPSIRFGKVTYKPLSGNYSIRGKHGTYYGNTNSSSKSHGSNRNDDYWTEMNAAKDTALVCLCLIPMVFIGLFAVYYEAELQELLASLIRFIFNI
jgi:hypothetical protein